MKSRSRLLGLVVAAFLSGLAVFAAWADYTGPNRTTERRERDPSRDSWTCRNSNPPPGITGTCVLRNPLNPCPDEGGFHPSVEQQRSWCQWGANYSDYQGCSCDEAYSTETTNLPPATVGGNFTCASTGNNGWCVGGASLELSASEPMAGQVITDIEGSVGELCDPPDGSSVSCSWSGSGDGSYSISFWAHSSYGDTSTQSSEQWRLDTVAPSASVNVSGGTSGGGVWYRGGPLTVTSGGSDATSGIAGGEVSVGGGPWSSSASISADGVYAVDVQVWDEAGHGATASTTVGLDNTPPSLSPSLQGSLGTSGWYVSDVSAIAGGTDALSGTASGEVEVDGSWYGSPHSFAGDGTYALRFRVRDNAGNEATGGATTVRIDTTVPSSQFVTPAEGSTVTASGILDLSGVSVDGLSGIAEADMSFDSGRSWRSIEVDMATGSWGYRWDTRSVPNGTYSVMARARDVAGNEESTARITVVVVNAQPPAEATKKPRVAARGPTVTPTPTATSTPDPGLLALFVALPPTEGPHLLPLAPMPADGVQGEVPAQAGVTKVPVQPRVPWWPLLLPAGAALMILLVAIVDPRPPSWRRLGGVRRQAIADSRELGTGGNNRERGNGGRGGPRWT